MFMQCTTSVVDALTLEVVLESQVRSCGGGEGQGVGWICVGGGNVRLRGKWTRDVTITCVSQKRV